MTPTEYKTERQKRGTLKEVAGIMWALKLTGAVAPPPLESNAEVRDESPKETNL